MKVFAISGSRNPEGHTAAALNALCEGVREAGCEVETVFLPELNLEACRQCEEDGWGVCRSEQRCVIEDDFDSLFDRLCECDALVVASPVYYSDISEKLRVVLDRLRRIVFHGGGEDKLRGKPSIALCVAGGSGGGAARCCWSLETQMLTCGLDVVDVIPVRRQNLEAKKDALHSAGRWLAGLPSSA